MVDFSSGALTFISQLGSVFLQETKNKHNKADISAVILVFMS